MRLSSFLLQRAALVAIVVFLALPVCPAENGPLRKCAVTEPSRSKKAIDAQLNAFRQLNAAFRQADVPITVHVQFHVITTSDGKEGAVADKTLDKQIKVLNQF